MHSDDRIDVHECSTDALLDAIEVARGIAGDAAVLVAQLTMAHEAESSNNGMRDLAEYARDLGVRTLQHVHEGSQRLVY